MSSNKTHRIKTPDGRWCSVSVEYGNNGEIERDGWLREDFTKILRQALVLDSPAKSDQLSLAVELLDALGLNTRNGWLARQDLASYVTTPHVSFSPSPGKATMIDPATAGKLVDQARKAVALRKILPKAVAQAKARGANFLGADDFPELSKRCKDLASASVEIFNAADEMDEKHCYAIYVDYGSGKKGFLDRTSKPRNDMAEACLFPSLNSAASFARRRHRDCHYVKVVVSAVESGVLIGVPGISADLAIVVASRERKAIEEMLGEAEIEMLRAELARRDAASGVEAAPPKRSGRL